MRAANSWRPVVVLALVPVAVLVVLGWVDPPLTAYLVSEEGPVEWVQTGLCAIAAGLALAQARRLARAGQSPAFDVVVATALIVITIGELDLDRVIFGTKLIGMKFLLHPRQPVAWPWRVIANLIALGGPAVVLLYAATRIPTLIMMGLAALAEPWGRILLVGVVVFGVAQGFERVLGKLRFPSPLFLEEVSELAASGCFVAAYLMRPRDRSGPDHR